MNGLDKFPKLLVIGNCCLSDTTSNGRTLRNFLIGWPKDKLAQFCIHFEKPDFSLCDNYYCISDRDALNAFCFKGAKNGTDLPEQKQPSAAKSADGQKVGRNALSAYLREIIWASNRWKGVHFDRWVDAFAPELILLQAGDCGFIFRIALKIAKKYHIPIVVYNTEAYYFKDFDYLGSTGYAKKFYPILKRRFRKDFNRLMAKAHSAIYCCEMLTEDYKKVFSTPGVTIFTATECVPCDKTNAAPHPFRISYLGNLGVGRHEGLVAIGEALQSISPEAKLDVYGKIPNDAVKAAFESCSGINYKGFVSYDEVQNILRDSDVLVHTENFSDYYRLDLKYAFSTKIADSLASGTCFMLYAPSEIAASQYLLKHEAAYVVSKEDALKSTLELLMNDLEARSKYLPNAKELVQTNHVADKNSAAFQKILKDSVYGE